MERAAHAARSCFPASALSIRAVSLEVASTRPAPAAATHRSLGHAARSCRRWGRTRLSAGQQLRIDWRDAGMGVDLRHRRRAGGAAGAGAVAAAANAGANRIMAAWLALVAFDLAVRAGWLADPSPALFKPLRLVTLFPFLHASLFFLYVRALTTGRGFRPRDLAHLAGFGVALLALSPVFLLDPAAPPRSINACSRASCRRRSPVSTWPCSAMPSPTSPQRWHGSCATTASCASAARTWTGNRCTGWSRLRSASWRSGRSPPCTWWPTCRSSTCA